MIFRFVMKLEEGFFHKKKTSQITTLITGSYKSFPIKYISRTMPPTIHTPNDAPLQIHYLFFHKGNLLKTCQKLRVFINLYYLKKSTH